MTCATGGGECGNCRCEHGYKYLYGLFFDDFPHFFTNSFKNSNDFSVFWCDSCGNNSPPPGRRGWGW